MTENGIILKLWEGAILEFGYGWSKV